MQKPSFLLWPVYLVTSPWMCGWRAQGVSFFVHPIQSEGLGEQSLFCWIFPGVHITTKGRRWSVHNSLHWTKEKAWGELHHSKVHFGTKVECSQEELCPWVVQLCSVDNKKLELKAGENQTAAKRFRKRRNMVSACVVLMSYLVYRKKTYEDSKNVHFEQNLKNESRCLD